MRNISLFFLCIFCLPYKYLGKSLSKHILSFLITNNIKDKFCMMKYTFTDKVQKWTAIGRTQNISIIPSIFLLSIGIQQCALKFAKVFFQLIWPYKFERRNTRPHLSGANCENWKAKENEPARIELIYGSRAVGFSRYKW